ncbi:MarR family winged helix-turn-helix transcriptional regulator [Nocardia nepalensis]|uniref:MarR family winged helix-turn-helix transcriptional regulator n=1 Tax=Nocardia nepalensis TaxID=3375448 RepID=UPI003B67930B
MDEDERSVDTIAIQLTRLQRIRDRTAGQLRTKEGVDPAAFAILFRLLCDGPMRAGALADAVHSDASTISRHIAHLVDRQLVERQADRNDGRATVLVVTELGREVAERIRRRRHENLTRVMAAWTPQDRATFAGLLQQFVDDYEQAKPAMLAAIREDQNLYRLETENNS